MGFAVIGSPAQWEGVGIGQDDLLTLACAGEHDTSIDTRGIDASARLRNANSYEDVERGIDSREREGVDVFRGCGGRTLSGEAHCRGATGEDGT
jgi:hypothetical protein